MSVQKIVVIGSSNIDMTVLTDRLPLPGETVLGGKFIMGQGGKGANQAVAVGRLGGKVRFISKVGNDMFGKKAIDHYRSEGIEISGIQYSSMSSGVALITVDKNAENCIVVASGANDDWNDEDIEACRNEIETASILLLQLEIPINAVMKAAEIAHKAGVYVVLNPAPCCHLPEEIYQNISLIIPNETEVSRMTGLTVTDEFSAFKAAEVLASRGIEDVIITMGSKGAAVRHFGQTRFVPARRVKAVDTTAAGDTFCGAICVALSEEKNLFEAVEFATAASSVTVQKIGAQDSIPYRADVNF